MLGQIEDREEGISVCVFPIDFDGGADGRLGEDEIDEGREVEQLGVP